MPDQMYVGSVADVVSIDPYIQEGGTAAVETGKQMGDTVNQRAHFDTDRAVSPVIGVLLMVAITVILAAVIGTFVLELGSGVSTNIKAGASVEVTDDNEVNVIWNNNQNANDLRVEVTGCVTDSTTLNGVGDTWSSATGCSAGDTATVIVTAIGDGDSETVIVDENVGF